MRLKSWHAFFGTQSERSTHCFWAAAAGRLSLSSRSEIWSSEAGRLGLDPCRRDHLQESWRSRQRKLHHYSAHYTSSFWGFNASGRQRGAPFWCWRREIRTVCVSGLCRCTSESSEAPDTTGFMGADSDRLTHLYWVTAQVKRQTDSTLQLKSTQNCNGLDLMFLLLLHTITNNSMCMLHHIHHIQVYVI